MTTTANFFRKARTINATAASFGSFTAKIPTATAPTTSEANGVYDLLDRNLGLHLTNLTSKFIQIVPYAVASSNDTFDMRLWGWTETQGTSPIYIPQLLLTLNVTIGNISGTAIAAGTLMADTIVVANGDTDSPVISPANDLSASVLCHLRGCRFIEWDWDATGTPPTSMNAFWRVADSN